VEIYDKDMIGDDDLEGIVNIPLINLINQQKVDNWYELENEDGEEEKGKLRLRLQLIWSRLQYFQDNLNRTDERMKKIKKDMEDLDQYLQLFEKPFGILLFVEIDDNVSRIMWGDTEEIQVQTIARRSVLSPKHPRDLVGTLDNMFKGTFKRNIEWNQLTKAMMYCVVIFSCLALFSRSDFVNLAIGVTIWLIFIREERFDVTEYLEQFFRALLIVAAYDFFWLFFHSTGYWNSEINAGLRRFALVFAYLNFFAKIVLAGSLYIQIQKAKKQNKPPVGNNPNLSASIGIR